MNSDAQPWIVEDPRELPLEERLRRKEERLQAESTRGLDPWERYRALVDTLEQGMDHVELADRKARFALVLMGALNVGCFLVATRSGVIERAGQGLEPWIVAYLLVYAGVALYFLLEAIESLRPRSRPARVPEPADGDRAHHPRGLRDFESVATKDLAAYRAAWAELRVGQLNAELAIQNHALACVNVEKYRSLHRLYAGLRVLTILAGGLLLIVVLVLVTRQRHPAAVPQAENAAALVESTAPPASLDDGPC